jgi:type I restriction enzyme R subunit
VDEDWIVFVEKKKQEELQKIIEEEKLNSEETHQFIKNAFRNGEIPTTGTAITKILPPVSRFNPNGQRTQKRESVLEKLLKFFERFFDISSR